MGLSSQALPKDKLASEELLQREYLKSIFITLDQDLNGITLNHSRWNSQFPAGFISQDELREFDELSAEQQQKLFAAMDKQRCKDGRVGLDEFLAYWICAIETTSWRNIPCCPEPPPDCGARCRRSAENDDRTSN